ncbi:MAG: hypothetical protein WBA57_20830 [Elainellaceae cyanobacterium]
MQTNEIGPTPEQEQQFLCELIKKACQHPRKSREYRKLVNQLIGTIQQSPQLYQARDMLRGYSPSEYKEIYGEALQRTLIEINRKLCDYDETRSRVIVLVNNILKWRLKDVLREKKKDTSIKLPPTHNEEGNEINPLDKVPASHYSLMDYAAARSLRECLSQKVENNSELLYKIHLGDRPDINAYQLLSAFINTDNPPTLKELAAELGATNRRLRRFHRERCLPHLQRYITECGC